MRRRVAIFLAGSALLGACSTSVQSGTAVVLEAAADDAEPTQESGAPSNTLPAATSTTTVPPSTSSPVTTSSTTTTTTTTTEPAPDLFDPACVVQVEQFDSLGLIANRFDDETVNVVALRAENGLPTAAITEGQFIDVCVGNGLDDVTGEQRADPDEALVAVAVQENVEIQQLKLNKLFTGLGTPELLVDGVSGPVTRQRLCAARLALGLPTNTEDMAPGSAEETLLFATAELPVPPTSATASSRWILIDRTCQIMFTGESADTLTFMFPTSTGSAGFETRNQDRSRAFRFDPAVDNGGWHDSTDFPVAADNPLNGNMYRPLYFDLGQAIHGANNVPTTPQSKGCARLRVSHQDQLVSWLSLDGAQTPIWSERELSVTVNVQGQYISR